MSKIFEGVVAVCTRGMLMTEVFDGIMRNIVPRILNGHYWTARSTWNDPIPDAQNKAAKESLAMDPDYVWIVEEDTVPPVGILAYMISLCTDVVAANYKMDDGNSSLTLMREDKHIVQYGGIGCMLVRRKVFDKIAQPWFTLGYWTACPDGSFGRQGLRKPPRYGSQDTSFYVRLSAVGIKVRYAGDNWKCRHLRCDSLGERGINDGLHSIRAL